MIIKSADNKDAELNILKNLLTHPQCDALTKKRIEQEVRNIQAGIRGEAEAAYEMKVHYQDRAGWMVIHDLRIEHGDLVAQIDHLMINRFLEIWVCESKHFSEGVAINEHGEFTAFFAGKPYGVPSPLAQNERHILILKRLFDSGAVSLPSRLGFTLKPALKSLVLISKNARIARQKIKIDGLDCIIKTDQLIQTIDKAIDDSNNPLLLAKLVAADTVEALARALVKLHKPIKMDWTAKFGLTNQGLLVKEERAPLQTEKLIEQPEPIVPVSDVANQQEEKLDGAATPLCPKCGSGMVQRTAKKGTTVGQVFWGCSQYPKCRSIMPLA